MPSFVFNTVDNPIFPTTGRRLTTSIDFAGPGGNTNFIKPTLEARQFLRLTPRMSVGCAGQVEYIRPYGDTKVLPIFERLFLGGEYSVRGFDIRSIGPRDPVTGVVLGGNKSLLFNAEYIDPDRRAGAAGAVLRRRPGAQPRPAVRLDEDILGIVPPPAPPLIDPLEHRPGRSERAGADHGERRSATRAPSRPRPAPRSASSCRC